jgi:hypothetical protein
MILNQLRTFFVTAVAYQRQSHLRRASIAELFLETLFHYRQEKVFLLHEFVANARSHTLDPYAFIKIFSGKGAGKDQRRVLISDWETCGFEDRSLAAGFYAASDSG